MRFGLVTVAILLAVASKGYGRPRDPDPFDGSSQEITATMLGAASKNGNSDSRYLMTKARQSASTSLTSNLRRDISISSIKYGSSSSSSNKSNWIARSVFPGLSFETGRKNYLPLGALTSVSPRNDIGIKPIGRSRQLTGKQIDDHHPLTIPIIITPRMSMPIPIPVFTSQKNEITSLNLTLREEKKLPSLVRSAPKPIPISIPQKTNSIFLNSTLREERKLMARTLVRIVPQRLRPGYNVRKNSTVFKAKPQAISSVQLKNWPNEAMQNVQDLFNYEKYTSFDDDIKDNSKIKVSMLKAPNREPLIKSPEIQAPIRWTKIPVVEVTTPINDRVDVDTTMKIDNLLDDLGNNKIYPQFQTSSEVAQNTVVHILNAGSRKPNVTVVKPTNINKINRTKTANTRPPQNVHIMFMMNKDESANQTAQQKPPTQILGTDTDCPTIMINSITQINNTIESKEGCTDLNIVINSHILNTHILKPSPSVPTSLLSSTEALKDPYISNQEVSTDSNNYGNNNYYQNNNNTYKEPDSQVQYDEPGNLQPVEPVSEISTFELFQGTNIHLGGSSETAGDVPNEQENVDAPGTSGSDDSTGTDTDGSPFTDPEEGLNDVTGTNPEEVTSGGNVATGTESSSTGGSSADSAVTPPEAVQSSGPESVAGDIGSGQANDAPGAISLPSLPNVPNLPNIPNQLSNLASNVGSGGPGSGGSGQTGLAPASVVADEEDDDDELAEALSPVGLLDSITSVFEYVNVLNPINYGIFGMAVAPFVAFAAGIVGVAAFIFPWAFPGSFELGRTWDDSNNKMRIRYNPSLRDVVHSSIHKYRHLNEWKGRRRKRKRKR